VIGLLVGALLLVQAGQPRGAVERSRGWSSDGPIGGFVSALALAPSNPSRPPVVPPGAWTSPGPEGDWLFGVSADLRAPGALYAVTGGGVFLSEDGGASWVSRSQGLVDLPSNLIVGAGDPPALYGSSSLRFYRSLDGGLTWDTSDTVRSPLAVDPVSSRRVFAQGGVPLSSCSLDVSNDGGQTWTSVFECPGDGSLSSMVFDPQDPRTLYMSSYGGSVVKSVNGGTSWSPSGQGIPTFVNGLAINPHDPRTLYANIGTAIYKTGDAGATWRKASAQPPTEAILSLAIDPADGDLYTATVDGLYRSAGGDVAWTLVSPLLLNDLLIFADPSAPFLARGLDGPVRSDDRGVSWTDASGGLYGATIRALAVAPDGGLFAATGGSVFVSSDGGRSWTKHPYSFSSGSWIVDLVAASNPPVLYAATNGDGVRSSADGGQSWDEVGSGLGSTQITRLVRTPSGVLIAAGNTGLYVRRPGGDWVRGAFFGDAQVSLLEASPSSDGVVYAGTLGALFRSADAGATWLLIRPDLVNLTALALDPNDSRVLYAVLTLSLYEFPTFQKSTDSGQTWTAIGLEGVSEECLAVDPSNSQVVYACSGSTLFRSPNGGQTWSRFAQGIAFSPSISRVVVGPDGRAHLATLAQSVLDRNFVREVREVPRPGAAP